MWSSRPSIILILSSVADLSIVTVLALTGFLMAPLAPIIVGGLFLAAVALAFVLDQIKLWLFARLAML